MDASVDPDPRRASDHDREEVIDQLRTAAADGRLTLDEFGERVTQVLDTKTVEDLVPFTADLPPALSPTASGPGSPSVPTAVAHRRLVTLFGRSRHIGSWEIGSTTTVVAVFGHSELDLTGCRLPPGVEALELRTFGLFAGVELVVPPNAAVDVGGVALFGGRHLQHAGPSDHDAPGVRLRVRAYGVFSGLLVRNRRRVP